MLFFFYHSHLLSEAFEVLGRGKIDVPVNVAAHKFSVSAEKLIEKAGGKITKI